MQNYEQELTIELAHYHDIAAIIHNQIENAKLNLEQSTKALQETHQDMWENASHSADDFDRIVEINQYSLPLDHHTFSVENNAKKLETLERLLESPYFARIDFHSQDQELDEPIYIGRGALLDDNSQDRQIYIYDWRSPIASLFYRFETGTAFYDAPDGRIAGDITRKRQYEIKHRRFEYFFEADVQIADEFLRKMLSGNTSSKMKTIVETIQKDQDIAIRDMSHHLLMIQGIAGSGKTSIALHRVAYLKYQGLANRLKSSDLLILSPNTLFEQYISNVLPELGEDEIRSLVFDDLIREHLPNCPSFQSHYEQTEMLISCADPSEKELSKEAITFKMSAAFIKILNRYADSLPTAHIAFTDIQYDDRTVFSSQKLKDLLLQMPANESLVIRLYRLRQYIFDHIHELRTLRMPKLQQIAREDPDHPFDWGEYARALSIEECTLLARTVESITKPDTKALYKKLFLTDGLLLSLAKDIELPDTIAAILDHSQILLKTGDDAICSNADALAVTYLQLLIDPSNRYQKIRQVVVDEAQDYDDIHFEIIKQLFPNARYTILGDINQTIEKQETLRRYDRITEILHPASACLMTMNKSFRCTKEILTFSTQFLSSDTPFESFNRSGDVPQVIAADTIDSLDNKLMAEAAYSKNLGYQSIAIICKETAEAEALYHRLKDKTELRFIHAEGQLETTGVFVIPITMSKGLEFDSVLIYGVDKKQYASENDKKLLYIASTRALHRLNLFYTGEKSLLIDDDSHPGLTSQP